MKKVVTFPGLAADDRPMGAAPLSSAIHVPPFLFLSGQVGIDPSTRAIAGPDIRSQTRQALENIRSLVETAGMSMGNIVKLNIYLVDPSSFAAMNDVYSEFFDLPYPARATVGVSLNDPDLLIEIDGVAMS